MFDAYRFLNQTCGRGTLPPDILDHFRLESGLDCEGIECRTAFVASSGESVGNLAVQDWD